MSVSYECSDWELRGMRETDEVVVLKCVWTKSGRRYMFVLTLSPPWRTSVSSASMVEYCRRWSLRTSGSAAEACLPRRTNETF